MIKYKIDIINALKNAGITAYSIKTDKKISGDVMTKLRHHDTNITMKNLNKLCEYLQCQPGDLIEWIPDNLEGKKE